MLLSFDTNVASYVGINSAIIFQNIMFWINKNENNEKNFHENSFWTYNTVKAFQIQFPMFSASQIRTAIDKLISSEYLITGNFNINRYDQTLWYAIGKNGMAHYCKTFDKIMPNQNLSLDDSKECLTENEEKHVNKRFVPPALEEVTEYALASKISINHANEFILFYNSKDWHVGKNKMKNWKSAYSLWCMRNNGKKMVGNTPFTRPISKHVNRGGDNF